MNREIIKLKKELAEYAELILTIRELSAVSLKGVSDSDGYADKLSNDYRRIVEIGARCRQILSDTVYPLIRRKDDLSRPKIDALMDFCDLLIEPATGEEIDLFLLYEVSDRLLLELEKISDDDGYARQLNTHVSVCYANVNRTARLTTSREICTFYRDMGLAAAHKAMEILKDRERFLELSNAGRIYILRISRFYSALYDTFYFEEETNRIRYQALVDALSLADDAFCTDSVTDYNWKLHRIRCIEHMGQLTERGNRWGFTQEQCSRIFEWLLTLNKIKDEDATAFFDILPESHYRLLMLRNSFYADMISEEEYRSRLLELYSEYSDSNQYDMYAAQMNLLIPLEYISSLHDTHITAREQTQLRYLYDSVIEYIIKSVNLDAFNFLQEYLIGFLEEFIEIPGVMSFMDMGLSCMAALHPPTFVHSFQVADICRCLTEHMYVRDTRRRSYIESRIYGAALCHDFGKLTMIDSIFIYGRDLLDREYDIIHLHTDMGAKMLLAHNSTSDFAKYSEQHHIWHDGKGGYPNDGEKPSLVAEMISVADSIDAATDNIGRSYRRGKTLDEICAEIKEAGGTRYSPYIVRLLDDEGVRADLTYIITEGRRLRYKRLYQMLSGMVAQL